VSRVYLVHFGRRFYSANNAHSHGIQQYVGVVLAGDLERVP
jgi:hypothetical protein